MKRNLWRLFSIGLPTAVIAVASCTFALADLVQPVSQADPSVSPSASAAGDSGTPIISGDGRFVLFASAANNLAASSNSTPLVRSFPARLNVYLRDRAGATTTLVSVNLEGTGGGNGDSLPAGISTNGRYALFESTATNLVAGDTNNAADVFLRDLENGVTLLVTARNSGGSGNGAARNSVMTPDGRYVAFVSAAADLVVNDTNNIPDVFVRDIESGNTTLVSVGAISTNSGAAASASDGPQITPDGRCVAFYSTATNLVPDVLTGGEVYLRNLIAETTTWVSTNARAIYEATAGSTNIISCNHRISADGNIVAFEACTNRPTASSARGIILRHNVQTGVTDIIHTNATVPLVQFERIRTLDMTSDGRFIAFVANESDFSGALTNAIYRWDADTGSNELVSADLTAMPAPGLCESPVLSSNGQHIAFISGAQNLTTNTRVGEFHLYVRDLQAGITRLVNVSADAVGVGLEPTAVPALSADGRVIAFECPVSLLADDRNGSSDVFVRDTLTELTELVSTRHPDLPGFTGNAFSGSSSSVSGNGRYIAFTSYADNLVANDTNGLADVFVRDLLTGATVLVRADTNGSALPAFSSQPAINGDGRYVVFCSRPEDATRIQQVYVRDMQTATTLLVSLGLDGTSPGNRDSSSPAISEDGRWILFRSKASNLVSGVSTIAIENLFLRDMQLQTNYALTRATSGTGVTRATMTPDGRYIAFSGILSGSTTRLYVWDSQSAARVYTNDATPVSTFAISPNGQRLAYWQSGSLTALDRSNNTSVLLSTGLFPSRTRLEFSGDGQFLVYSTANAKVPADNNSVQDVYVHDFQSGPSLISRGLAGSANGVSDSPAITTDGRFVTYRSVASNIVTGDLNGMPDVFLYDRALGTTRLLSVNQSETATANNLSLLPVFSRNGRTLVFLSLGSDLAVNDFNLSGDLFAFEFPYASITSGAGPGAAPTLSWPALPGHIYFVQSKTNLNDSDWQDVTGSITTIGYRGYLTNAGSLSSQKFYRVVSE